jgi:hypothetical protein
MFLQTKLENQKNSIKICFIKCSKFVSMFFAQYNNNLFRIKINNIIVLNK